MTSLYWTWSFVLRNSRRAVFAVIWTLKGELPDRIRAFRQRRRGPQPATPTQAYSYLRDADTAGTWPLQQVEGPAVDGRSEWASYESMKAKVSGRKEYRIDMVQETMLPLIDLSEASLMDTIAEIRFRKEESPIVSIIIPVYNNLKYTLECLISISRYSGSSIPYEIIIADDASSDETEAVISKISNIIYTKNEENLGFLLNCNRAATRANGQYLLFLNNDVQVTAGWLSPLVERFEKEENVGAVGSRIVFPNGRLQEAGGLVNPNCGAELIGLFDDHTLPRYNFARKVDYCSGACLLVERRQFKNLGGFDTALVPAYCEDMDLCLRLKEMGLDTWYEPQSMILHHLSKTSDLIDGSYKIRCITQNQQKMMERWGGFVARLNHIRPFAFYLPQFHRIAENDRWWGNGFTEWSNVARATKQYVGHHQPQLPADLGFYDLTTESAMIEQINLAQRYGIEGFCFYYYWFAGKRLLERPLERMLASTNLDFPFFVCWANENWTRRWDGRESEVLMAQGHSDDDDADVINDLMRYFRDRRYVRINGKPLVLVYRVDLFPDFKKTAETWRQLCREAGIGEIYLAMVESFGRAASKLDPALHGCDACVQFPPHNGSGAIELPKQAMSPAFEGSVYDYETAALGYLEQPMAPAPRFPATMPSWDNTARRMEKGTIFDGASPGAFQAWLEAVIQQTREHNYGEERILFINAWNEWAEGAHLEPDKTYGHGYLEAVRNALAAHSLTQN